MKSVCILYLLLTQQIPPCSLVLKMSSRELAEAGVVGADDEPDSVWEPNSTASERELETSDDRCHKMVPEADPQVFHSGSSLLTELRQVHALDEMIVEEKLKIHMFRQKEKPDEELPRSKILDSNGLVARREREAFRLQLEREKREVDVLEKSLENECKAKEQSKKVIRCSVMETTRAEAKDDKAEDLAGSRGGSRDARDTAPACSDPALQRKTEPPQEASDLHVETENASSHPSPLPASRADHLECETSLLRRTAPGVQPLECVFTENPDASLTPELGPDDGAFDPGGNRCVPPLPNPREASLATAGTPCSAEIPVPPPSSVTDELVRETAVHKLPGPPGGADMNHGATLPANVKELNNNNNNQAPAEEPRVPSDLYSGRNMKDDDDTLSGFEALGDGDVHSAEEVSTLAPVSRGLLPEPPLGLQLGGGDHQDADWMRGSRRDPSDGEPRLDPTVGTVMRLSAHAARPGEPGDAGH